MRSDKLRNLLNEFDGRLFRLEKAISQSQGERSASPVLEHVAGLRAATRRHLSKPDTFRLADVAELETRIDKLRSAAGDSSHHLDPTSQSAADLDNIFSDKVGLLNLTSGMRIGLSQLSPDDVLEVIPGQKTAAFQFGFAGDRLVTIDQPVRPSQRERELALAALATAIQHSELVNKDLAPTNVSPRLKEAFMRLEQTMATHANVVQIGQYAQMCNRLIEADVEELSASQFGLLIGHVEMVFSTLAQFEDWRIFAENAAAVRLEPGSVVKLADGARQLEKQMIEIEAVDRTVTDALSTVTGWVDGQSPADRRDVLSLARTIENIWSIICKVVLSLGKEVYSEAKKMAAKAILVSLLGVAVYFTPVLGAIPGGEWLRTVASYFLGSKTNTPPGP